MIVTPPTNTGSRTANGVIFPVRPVWTSIDFNNAVRSSGGNLRDRPPRSVTRRAEPTLELRVVDLDHRAVDLPVEGVRFFSQRGGTRVSFRFFVR